MITIKIMSKKINLMDHVRTKPNIFFRSFSLLSLQVDNVPHKFGKAVYPDLCMRCFFPCHSVEIHEGNRYKDKDPSASLSQKGRIRSAKLFLPTFLGVHETFDKGASNGALAWKNIWFFTP